MSIGAFGENFPYTNFHNLNTDWILGEIVKFKEEYTNVQNLINETTTADIERLNNAKNEMLLALNTWYNEHSEEINEDLANAINDFQVAVTNIVDQTIPSIPADYTALSNSVVALEDEIPKLISLITENNKNSEFMYLTDETYTFNGVTFTAHNNTVHISGTSVGVSAFDIFNSKTKKINFPFKKGQRYYLIFKESGLHGLYKQVQYRTTDGGAWTSVYSTNANNDGIFLDMPNNLHEYCIRLTCDSSGKTFNTDITFTIVPAIYNLNTMDETVITSLKKGYLDYKTLYPFYNSDVANYYGVNITNIEDGITLRGTATATKTYIVMEDFDNAIFKPGTQVCVDYEDQVGDLYLEVVAYTGIHTPSPSALPPLLQTISTGNYIITFPQVFDYVAFRLILFNGVSYNHFVRVNIHQKDNTHRTYIVAKDGTGDYTTIKEAVEEATKYQNSTVVIKEGTYDLVSEFGKTYLDNLQSGYFGMVLKNGITIQGSPRAYITFNYDGTNPWIIENFSPFNTGNITGYTLDGVNMSGRNCRYLIHDDPRPGQKEGYSKNVFKNCNFTIYPSPDYANWKNHQIIGGGLGDNTIIEIDSCIFNAIFTDDVTMYSSVSYHNSSSGSLHYQSSIIVKNCYFADKNRLVFVGYGSAGEKTPVMITNNCFENVDDDILYDNNVDNMTIYKWNNVSR